MKEILGGFRHRHARKGDPLDEAFAFAHQFAALGRHRAQFFGLPRSGRNAQSWSPETTKSGHT